MDERLGQLIYEQLVCVHGKTLTISDAMFTIKHNIDYYKLLRRSYVAAMISVGLICKSVIFFNADEREQTYNTILTI